MAKILEFIPCADEEARHDILFRQGAAVNAERAKRLLSRIIEKTESADSFLASAVTEAIYQQLAAFDALLDTHSKGE